jgi:hypothetical protein
MHDVAVLFRRRQSISNAAQCEHSTLALMVVLVNLFYSKNKPQDQYRQNKQSGPAQLTGRTPRPSEADWASDSTRSGREARNTVIRRDATTGSSVFGKGT